MYSHGTKGEIVLDAAGVVGVEGVVGVVGPVAGDWAAEICEILANT